MELTRILLNLANPGVRRDITDPYEMHSTLARAFAPRPDAAPERYLWRLEDITPDRPPVLLVQSEKPGQWDQFAQAVPGWMLQHQSKAWHPAAQLRPGAAIAFRIRCNPTVTRDGKRLGLWDEQAQHAWFDRQATKHGLEDIQISQLTSTRLSGRRRKGGGASVIVCAAQFDGVARIKDSASLELAIRQGLGHAKMMGLGLISVAPLVP